MFHAFRIAALDVGMADVPALPDFRLLELWLDRIGDVRAVEPDARVGVSGPPVEGCGQAHARR